jgi:hypothetical protein
MADAIIELYEGKLGGGKTYACVKRIYNCLLDGWLVQTNISLNWEVIKAKAEKEGYILDDNQYVYLKTNDVQEFYDHITAGSKTLLVLDEAHLWFSSREWKKSGHRIQEVLTQARKLQLHILLITQHRKNLDVQFVRQLQYIWICRDTQKYKILGMFHLPFRLFVQVCIMAETGDKMESRVLPKDTEIFKLYTSTELLKPIQLGFERPEINVRRIKKKKSPMKTAITIILSIIAGGLAGRFFTPKPEPLPEDVREVLVENRTHENPEKPVPSVPTYSGFYTLGGTAYANVNSGGWQPLPNIKSITYNGIIKLTDGTEIFPVASTVSGAGDEN